MSPLTRLSVVEFLHNRDGGGWDWETLAQATDEQVMGYASERHTKVEQDIIDLKAAGLWPMPRWMVSRGITMHGMEAMMSIVSQSEHAR
jgi:hypothetical protein